jgi:hypothetical protein
MKDLIIISIITLFVCFFSFRKHCISRFDAGKIDKKKMQDCIVWATVALAITVLIEFIILSEI